MEGYITRKAKWHENNKLKEKYILLQTKQLFLYLGVDVAVVSKIGYTKAINTKI